MTDFYVGLHRHTAFSRLDGHSLPEQIADRLVEIGQTAVGCTDHGSTFGLIPMSHALRARGIKLCPGVEFYQCPDLAAVGKTKETADKKEKVKRSRDIAHLTVLAKDQIGYRNMLKLYRLSFEHHHYKPLIDWDALIRHQEGLVVLSGCVGGMISRAINAAQADLAFEWCRYLKERIEHWYIEILPCPGLPISYQASRVLWRIAEELNIPTVLTDDGHFARPEDHEAQDAAVCIGTRCKKADRDRTLSIAAYHYYCTGPEIVQRALEVLPSVPLQQLRDAAARSAAIAEMINVELPHGKGPLYRISPQMKKDGFDAFGLLCHWINQGRKHREDLGLLPPAGSQARKEYQEREAYELSIIRHHDFSNYFLCVADIVRWARSKKPQVWCVARGSCGGSLVAWFLGITQIDPIRFNLPVERFIDKSRADMPDIDLDFDARYRDDCFRYLESKYGVEHTAQIAALSTFRARQSIHDVCDVYNIPEWVGKAVVRHLPELDNEGGIKDKGQLKRLFEECEALQPLLKDWPKLRIAAELEGGIRAQTIHAAGFIIDQEILEEVVGVEAIPGKARVIACDMNFAAQQGFLKIDALSVEMMSGVAEILTAIGKDFDWLYQLPLDDAATYAMLSKGRNMGVFQFKGHSSGKLLLQLQPDCINDLVALAALGRPGPLQSGGAAEYVERKHGRMPLPDYHPKVMAVLGDTYGVILYQEQVMGLMRIAGFGWPHVHKVRKLVSKSGGTAALEAYYPAYVQGMRTAGIPDEEAEHLWVQCQKAGNYVFNKAHGAMYALHGYWTAYLKCHHGSIFACVMANHEKKAPFQRQILREFKQQGGILKLLDPNQSGLKFRTLGPDTILGGFETISGVGPTHAKQMLAGQPYRDWIDFLTRCPASLAHDLQAAGIHTGKIDTDAALAIAPWFVDVQHLPVEAAAAHKYRATPIRDLCVRMETGVGDRLARIVGRVTDIQLSTSKTQGKPGVTSGVNERLLVTLTDETGSIDLWFSGWKWEEIKHRRNPLAGPTEGIGNSVYAIAVISEDRTRLFGEELICFRESKGMVHERTRAAMKSSRKKDPKDLQTTPGLFEPEESPRPAKGKRPPPGGLAKLEAQLADLN